MLKIGDVLDNGATVIATKGNVVLAGWEKGPTGRVEYVTWRFGKDERRDTYNGNYFLDLLDAVKSFYDRSR